MSRFVKGKRYWIDTVNKIVISSMIKINWKHKSKKFDLLEYNHDIEALTIHNLPLQTYFDCLKRGYILMITNGDRARFFGDGLRKITMDAEMSLFLMNNFKSKIL
jgi:hypothetical protein